MNWNGKYVSVHNIIAKAYRDMGMSNEINVADAIEWAGEALEFIGAPYHLLDKVESVVVSNYKAKIPHDLYYLVTASGAVSATPEADVCTDEKVTYTPMRYSTDAYHHWRCKGSEDYKCVSELTYKISDDYIFPNFESGRVLLAYRAMPVDDNGYPKIPDDIKFRSAVAAEIKWHLGFIQWSKGKMPGPVYQKLEQDRDWYVGAAQTRAVMPSVDMAESLKNNWLRLIPKINQHADGFETAGSAEQRYTQNSGYSSSQSDSKKDSDNTYFNSGQPFVVDASDPS